MKDSHRVSASQIEEGMKSKDEEVEKKKNIQHVEAKKVLVQEKHEEDKGKQAFDALAVHFHEDADLFDDWE